MQKSHHRRYHITAEQKTYWVGLICISRRTGAEELYAWVPWQGKNASDAAWGALLYYAEAYPWYRYKSLVQRDSPPSHNLEHIEQEIV